MENFSHQTLYNFMNFNDTDSKIFTQNHLFLIVINIIGSFKYEQQLFFPEKRSVGEIETCYQFINNIRNKQYGTLSFE